MTSGPIDPYYTWLGIPPEDQPPHHYRLLGLPEFESEREVIRNAADRQMSFVKDQALGEHLKLSQRILKELAAARATLLNAEKKRAYDAELRKALTPQEVEPARLPPVTVRKKSPRRPSPASQPQPGPLLALWVGVGGGTVLLVGGLIAFLLFRGLGDAAATRADVATSEEPAALTTSDRSVPEPTSNADFLERRIELEPAPAAPAVASSKSSAASASASIRLPESPPPKGLSDADDATMRAPVVARRRPGVGPEFPAAIDEGYVSSLSELPLYVPRATPADLQELEAAAQSTGEPQTVIATYETFERLFDVSLIQQEFEARLQEWRSRAVGDGVNMEAGAGNNQLESALARARAAIGRQDFGVASDILERTNREYAEDPRPSFLLGLLSVMNPDVPITRSVGYFRATSRNIEQNAAVLNNYALCCLLAGDHSAAVAAWRDVLAIAPREPAVTQNLGKMLEDSGRHIDGLPALGLRDRTRESVGELYQSALTSGAPASSPATGWLFMFLPEADVPSAGTSEAKPEEQPIIAPAVFVTPLVGIVRHHESVNVMPSDEISVQLDGEPARVLRRLNHLLFFQASQTGVPLPGWGPLVPKVGQSVALRLESGEPGPTCEVVGRSKTGDSLIVSSDSSIPLASALVVDGKNRPIGYLTGAYSSADQAFGLVATTETILQGARVSTATGSRDPQAEGAADGYRTLPATISRVESPQQQGVIGLVGVTGSKFRVTGGYLEDLRCSHCVGASTTQCRNRQCKNGTISVQKRARRLNPLTNKYDTIFVKGNEDCPRCNDGKIDCPFCTGGVQR